MRLLFMGRKQIAADALLWSCNRGFDIVGVLTDSHLSVSPTTEIANRLKLPLFDYETAQGLIENLQLSYDVAVSVVYWRYIKPPMLTAPKYGIINFHPAPLPKYKGTAGYNLAILNEENEWAVTAHYVDQSIDTGPIIDQFTFSIDPSQETAQTLEASTVDFMLKLYKKTMTRVMDTKTLPASPHTGGEYTSRREMEAMKQLSPDEDWDKKIRAFWFPPYTGAYIEKGGIKYTLVNQDILRMLAPKNSSSLFD